MRERRPLVAANWKMYKTRRQARAFLEDFLPRVRGITGVDVLICPPFTALETVAGLLAGQNVALGAQDLFWEEEGAFTGEIAAGMLVDVGCRYAIVGHSERRHIFGETDEHVARKLGAALGHGLLPVLCVGETLAEREAGHTEEVVRRQIRQAVASLPPVQMAQLTVAYEPVWAIGTGRNAQPADAAAVIEMIRDELGRHVSREIPARLRVLYGGSVKPGNIECFASHPQIDGALVGGASLDPVSFATITEAFVHIEPGSASR